MSDGLVAPPGRQGPGTDARRAGRGAGPRARAPRLGALPGERRAAGLGAGTELAQLRPYQVGRRRAPPRRGRQARTGVPHVRLQVPERVLTTWLVLDVSASMAFGTGAG